MDFGLDTSNKYNRMALMIGGGILATLLIMFLLVSPAWSRLKTLGVEVADVQQKHEIAEADLENLEKGQEFLQNNTNLIDSLNVAVPLDPDVPQIVVMLDALASKNGLSLSAITPQQIAQGTTADVSGSSATPIEISSTFSGEYPAMINFFYTLERSLRIVDVKSISITSRTTGGALTGTISFRSYYKTVEGGPTVELPKTPGAK